MKHKSYLPSCLGVVNQSASSLAMGNPPPFFREGSSQGRDGSFLTGVCQVLCLKEMRQLLPEWFVEDPVVAECLWECLDLIVISVIYPHPPAGGLDFRGDFESCGVCSLASWPDGFSLLGWPIYVCLIVFLSILSFCHCLLQWWRRVCYPLPKASSVSLLVCWLLILMPFLPFSCSQWRKCSTWNTFAVSCWRISIWLFWFLVYIENLFSSSVCSRLAHSWSFVFAYAFLKIWTFKEMPWYQDKLSFLSEKEQVRFCLIELPRSGGRCPQMPTWASETPASCSQPLFSLPTQALQ